MIRLVHSLFVPAAAVLAVGTLVGCAAPAAAPAPAPEYPYNSVQRFEQMDRVAMQIVRGTAATPDSDYQQMRPALGQRLARLGFTAEESRRILVRVDEARADRQRMRAWWAGVTGAEPTAHARR